ncbi:MAG: glycosyltransferase family 1 protein [Actinobacteria bacterium ATB1]|nr:glycosyltransferase family 1 protein [Actinobacteria bacterium ATB1]
MRVALNAEQLLHPIPGGIGTYCRALLTNLDSGDDCDVVPFVALHSRRAVESAMSRHGIPAALASRTAILPLPRPLLYDAWHLLRFPPTPWLARGLAGVDLVHATSVAVPPRGRRPLVVTVHDVAPVLHPETFPRRGVRFHRQGLYAAERADLVITVSEAAAAEIRENTGIDPGRIRVVPNGVEAVEVAASTVTSVRSHHGLSERPYVLWVGTIEPRKNVGTLVSAFAQLVAEKGFDHDLVLVGPGGWLDSGLVASCDVETLGRRLHLIGQVGHADLHALYAGADLVAVPSLHEGFGLPVLEAMAHGTPVAHSAIPALDEVAGSAGRRIPPTDTDAWRDAIGALLSEPDKMAQLAKAGMRRSAEFTWARCAAATLEVYREAVG